MSLRKSVILPAAISSAMIFAPQAYSSDYQSDNVDDMDQAKHEFTLAMNEVKSETKEAWHETKDKTANAWDKVKDGSKKAMNSGEKMFKDGMIAGRLETALILNEYVNPFEVDIEVENGDVLLSGTVDSEVEKELAVNIAKGVNGVGDVTDKIRVRSESEIKNGHPNTKELAKKSDTTKDSDREFSQYVSDVTTTASIKTELLANDSIKGLDINVDTYKDEVTLSGKVESSAQKSLAEAIAKKREDVTKVLNKLTVSS